MELQDTDGEPGDFDEPDRDDGITPESERDADTAAESVRISLFGTTGSGKTLYLREHFYKVKPCLWIDTAGDHNIDGAFLTLSPTEACDEMVRNPSGFCVVYRPRDLAHAQYPGRLALALGNNTVICEEARVYCPGFVAPPWLDRLSRLGRGYGTSLVITSQRPSEVPRVLTSQSSRVIVAGTIYDPSDVKYIEAVTSPEFSEAIERLVAPGKICSYSHFDVRTRKVMQDILHVPS